MILTKKSYVVQLKNFTIAEIIQPATIFKRNLGIESRLFWMHKVCAGYISRSGLQIQRGQ